MTLERERKERQCAAFTVSDQMVPRTRRYRRFTASSPFTSIGSLTCTIGTVFAPASLLTNNDHTGLLSDTRLLLSVLASHTGYDYRVTAGHDVVVKHEVEAVLFDSGQRIASLIAEPPSSLVIDPSFLPVRARIHVHSLPPGSYSFPTSPLTSVVDVALQELAQGLPGPTRPLSPQ